MTAAPHSLTDDSSNMQLHQIHHQKLRGSVFSPKTLLVFVNEGRLMLDAF